MFSGANGVGVRSGAWAGAAGYAVDDAAAQRLADEMLADVAADGAGDDVAGDATFYVANPSDGLRLDRPESLDISTIFAAMQNDAGKTSATSRPYAQLAAPSPFGFQEMTEPTVEDGAMQAMGVFHSAYLWGVSKFKIPWLIKAAREGNLIAELELMHLACSNSTIGAFAGHIAGITGEACDERAWASSVLYDVACRRPEMFTPEQIAFIFEEAGTKNWAINTARTIEARRPDLVPVKGVIGSHHIVLAPGENLALEGFDRRVWGRFATVEETLQHSDRDYDRGYKNEGTVTFGTDYQVGDATISLVVEARTVVDVLAIAVGREFQMSPIQKTTHRQSELPRVLIKIPESLKPQVQTVVDEAYRLAEADGYDAKRTEPIRYEDYQHGFEGYIDNSKKARRAGDVFLKHLMDGLERLGTRVSVKYAHAMAAAALLKDKDAIDHNVELLRQITDPRSEDEKLQQRGKMRYVIYMNKDTGAIVAANVERAGDIGDGFSPAEKAYFEKKGIVTGEIIFGQPGGGDGVTGLPDGLVPEAGKVVLSSFLQFITFKKGQ